MEPVIETGVFEDTTTKIAGIVGSSKTALDDTTGLIALGVIPSVLFQGNPESRALPHQ